MKVNCSMCKGQLIMDPGGELAFCRDCGMGYTVEHLARMLHPTAGNKSMGKKAMLNSVMEKVEEFLPGGFSEETAEIEAEAEVKSPEHSKIIEKPKMSGPSKNTVRSLFSFAGPHVWEAVKIEPVKIRILRSESGGYQVKNLYCVVESGSFDLTGLFYVDGDETKTIKLGMMKQGKEFVKSAEKGMEVMLPVCGKQIKLLKDAKYLTAPLALCGSEEEEEYFARILASCFKDCTVKRNICVTEEKPSVPVTFMLYKKDKPVLAIILCSSRVYDHRKIRNTMRACEKHRIKVQRYFAEFENDREYVIQRIRKAL